MNQVVEIVRRIIVIFLWLIGGGYGITMIGCGGYAFLGLIGLVELHEFEEWWWILVLPLIGLVIFVITYGLHKGINWIFQKGESKGTD